MSSPRATAERMYAALAAGDIEALSALLHPDFQGRMADNMPLGVGGQVTGPTAMMTDVWGVIARHFRVVPEPREFLGVAPDRVIVLGQYRGEARATARTFVASFAHDIRIRGDKVAGLVQVTDTGAWLNALTPGRSCGGSIS